MASESADTSENALTEEQVAERFRSRTFLDVAKAHSSFSENPPALEHVVTLHNAGQIDLLEIVNWPAWAGITSRSFFSVQQYLNRAIPQIDAPLDRILAFISALVEKGGNEGAALIPYDTLRQWFQQRPDQARAVCTQAQSAKFESLLCAVQGLGDIPTAQALVVSLEGVQQRAVIDALARIRHPTSEARAQTIDLLDQEVTRRSDDELRGAVLNALTLLFNVSQALIDDKALTLVKRVLGEGGANTLCHAARALLGSRAIMTPNLRTALLEALLQVDPEQHGTINLLDLGLSELVRAGDGKEAVDFLTKLLDRRDFEVPFTQFDSFCSGLFGSGPTVLGYAMGRWLSSGKGPLCLAIEAVFSQQGLVQKPVDLDLSGAGLSDEDAYFACRKAIGFLFIHPIVIACFHIATLRVVDAEHGEAILELLFDPLLTNFGGTVHEHLSAVAETDPLYAQVRTVLARGDAYVEGLRVGDIKELWPPEQHKMLEYHRRSDEMRDIMKGAHKRSIFADIVTRSTLLYGNRSISYVEGPDGERRRFDMELHSQGITQEWPRTETIDPVGLQEMLFSLRIERRP